MLPQLPKKPNAKASSALILAAVAALAATFPAGAGRAVAYPMETPDAPVALPSPTAAATARPNELPFDSSLLFVLDDSISSNKSRADDVVRVHLRDPLVLEGRTIAAAGAPATIRILRARAAQSGDVYGYVDIFFEPLSLPDGTRLPLRAPTSRLSVKVSAGHESTVGVEDTVEDVFIPYAMLYQIFRKGKNFELAPGAEIRARTEAVLVVGPHGTVAIATPRPIGVELQTPHAAYSPLPFATPIDVHQKPTPIPTLTPEPDDAPTPAPLSTPSPLPT